jgi:phosphoenolpyruvate-protein kinase (PTS system EI component)
LLDAADRLLYKAKGGGRSQGVCGNLEGDKEAVVTGMGEVS